MCRVAYGDASHPYRAPRTDFTACTILERFGNEQTSASVERVLKQLATEKATEILKASPPALAPPHALTPPADTGAPPAVAHLRLRVLWSLPPPCVFRVRSSDV